MNEIIQIENLIHLIRGQKVMLDKDLAELYGVPTKVLNQAVKRNIERFPNDFMFQLSKEEFEFLRSQFVTTKNKDEKVETRGGRQYLPYAFTEHGVTMLSSVLKSPKAIEINIQVVRAFIKLRQYALETKDLSQRLSNLEKYLISYCDNNEKDKEEIYKALDLLMERTKPSRIGFNTDKKGK